MGPGAGATQGSPSDRLDDESGAVVHRRTRRLTVATAVAAHLIGTGVVLVPLLFVLPVPPEFEGWTPGSAQLVLRNRLKSRHPLQRVRHVPERDLARDEPRRVQLSARDERQKLIVVGVRIALRPHHLPLPGDEVVDRDGDPTALLLRGEPHLDMTSVLAE